MKKKYYMKPECEYTTLLGGEICDMIQASKITGNSDGGEISIGDGGDNTGDAPPPTAKRFTSLWDDDEEEVDDIW